MERSTSGTVFCNDDGMENYFSFAGMVQLYAKKTMTSLKAVAEVEFSLHFFLFNFTHGDFPYLFDQEYRVTVPFSVTTAHADHKKPQYSLNEFPDAKLSVVNLSNVPPASMEGCALTVRLKVLYESIQKIN